MMYQDSQTLLEVRGLCASVNGIEILKGLDFTVKRGEVHAIMGPNGSGKSTFAKVLAGPHGLRGHGRRGAVRGPATCSELAPEERARAGVFLAFQYPIEIPGVGNSQFLRLAYNTVQAERGQRRAGPARVRRPRAREDEAAGDEPGFSRAQRQRRLFRRREEAQRDPADGAARAEARDPGRDRLRPGHRRAARRRQGVNHLASKDNAIVLVTHYQRLLELHRARLRARDGGGPHHQDRRQGAGARTRRARLRLDRGRSRRRRAPAHEHRRSPDAGALQPLDSLACRRPQRGAGAAGLAEQPCAPQAVERVGALSRADHARRGLALHRPRRRLRSSRFSRCARRRRLRPRDIERVPIDGGGDAAGVRRRRARAATRPAQPRIAGCGSRHAGRACRPRRGSWRRTWAGTSASRTQLFAALNTAFLHDAAADRRAARHGAGGARASAVHRDAASARPATRAAAGRAESGSAAHADRGLRRAAGRSLFHQRGDRSGACRQRRRSRHVRVQRESAEAFHMASCAVSLARASRYHSVSVALGAQISRLRSRGRCRPPRAPSAARRPGADRRRAARRHPHASSTMPQPQWHQPATAQMHRRRRRARGVQRQRHGAPRRAANRFVAVQPQPAVERQGAWSTPSRSSRFSPTT